MTRRLPDVIDAADYHRHRDRAMPESEVQDQIIESARRAGFDLIYHTWNSQHSAAGFPDLVMLHRSGRMVVIECKRETGKTTAAQDEWLERFEAMRDLIRSVVTDNELTPHVLSVFVARPSNRQDIIDRLAEYAVLD